MTSFLARLRTLFAVLFNQPIRVAGPLGAAHFFPREGIILPVMAGADGDGGAGDGSQDSGDDGDSGSDDEDAEDDKSDGDAEDEGTDGEDVKDSKDEDWKWQSRKHERRAKAEKKKREETEAKLRKREEADKTEQEKALDKAREEARSEVLTQAEKERRSDRLEVAVTRLANKSIEIGEGEDKKKVRFADSDDALLYIERAIGKGDIDADDIFDENNKVKVDALKGELAELLESKPHYQARSEASDEGGKKKGKRADGGADQGRGGGAGSKDLEEMSAEDHFKRIHRGDK